MCFYKSVTVDCGEIIYFSQEKQVACVQILLINKNIENVYPAYKISENRYGVGNNECPTIEQIKQNDEIVNILCETRILDHFIPVKWLYSVNTKFFYFTK